MKKLYFKKLWRGILFALIMYFIYGIGADLLVTLSNFFKERPLLQLFIVLGIPGTILFVAATHYRITDDNKFKAYNRAVSYDSLKLLPDLKYTLKSLDFICDVLVATTLIFLGVLIFIFIPAVRIGGALVLISATLSSLLIFALGILFYTVGDIISWTVTHKYYLAERDMVVMPDEMKSK